MRILLARHGETDWNAEGRYQGQGFDIPLSPTGRSQAEALASRLADFEFTRVVASPLLRARQTAEIVLGNRSVPVTLDPDLMEIAHGDWEGCLDAEVKKRDEARRRAWRETPHLVTLPGGESLEQVMAQAWSALCRACHGLQPQEPLGVQKQIAGILAQNRGDAQLESACLSGQRGHQCFRRRSNFSSR
jgi:probable phosphoglycerate mutase